MLTTILYGVGFHLLAEELRYFGVCSLECMLWSVADMV
jgi:hypothetical protein